MRLKKVYVFLFAFASIIISCKNQYHKYSQKWTFDRNNFKLDSFTEKASKKVKLRFDNNPFEISNRTVIFCLGKQVIYYDKFIAATDLDINIPNIFVNENSAPCLYILEPNKNDVYFFEPKDILIIDSSTKTIVIKFIKKDKGDNILFKCY